jgi:sec-independent protein translocase protein TatA
MWNGLQPWHLIILLVLGILVFGSRRLPDAARSLGKSMRIFKSEIRELQHEGKPEDPTPTKPSPVQSERVDTPAPDEKPTDARPA